MHISLVEWVGYAAMLALMIAFTMKDLRTLRFINTIGAILFVVYGFMLIPVSYPIIITNAFIAMVNLYYLFIKNRNEPIA